MNSLEYNALAKRGIKMLLGRQAMVQLLTFVGGIVLARTLTPAEFGLYGIATFVVGTCAMFGDFGFAPALVQKREEINTSDLAAAFTLQQISATIIVVILWIFSPLLAQLYPKAPPETVWLVRSLAFNLYLSSLRTAGIIQLERQLQYSRIARVEVVESILFQAIVVFLAVWCRLGVWSFIWATLARGLAGGLLVYYYSPWPINLCFDRKIASECIRFGLPFQLQNLLNACGGWVTPLLVGNLIGPQGVGYITWAFSNGKKPLVLVDSVIRVAFAHFARIQDEPDEVRRVLSRYLGLLLLPAGIWVTVILVAGPALVRLLYSDNWLPAVPALALAAIALSWDVISWLTTTVLNGIGKVGYATKIYALRSALNIILGALLVLRIGMNGVAVAYLISVMLSSVLLLVGISAKAGIRVLIEQMWIAAATIAATTAGFSLAGISGAPLVDAALSLSASFAVYFTMCLLLMPKWMSTRASVLASKLYAGARSARVA